MNTLAQLLPVYFAYILTTASPGPSNMAIMGTAMREGRRPALAFACGTITGSATWACLAASGLSAVLATYADAMTLIRIVGGLYLLFLAWRAARSALRATAVDPRNAAAGVPVRYGALYRRGLLLHLTNPKAILGWISIMSLGLRPDMPGHILPLILGGCIALGITIFTSYALLFSTPFAVAIYARLRRWIEASIALFFGSAALYLLTARS